ncbi:MAG TPA: amidohydrolase [Bryobacteraceae bacterium]|nr:amidohydrolase [Bryobacteraceae bacterium]
MKFVALMTITSGLAAQSFADLVLTGGKIWTGTIAQPQVEAVACIGPRIVAMGSSSDIGHSIGPQTRVVDLAGKLMVPGFNDAHVHFYTGGQHLASVKLRDAQSEGEFRERIRKFAAQLPPGRWILGGDWDHENWTPARLPTRQLIDAVTADHPVFLNRLDGHMSLANTAALKLAGVDRNTPDPPGGTIVRDEKGEPTGVLKDAAAAAVERVIPAASDDEIADAVRAAMRYAAENGVTSVQDMSAAPEILRVYQKLLKSGELTVRISGHQPLATWERLADVGLLAAFGSGYLHIGGLKGFADGSLGSTTALFFDPYLDAPATSGLASDEMIPESKMRKHILDADRAGLQIAVHAIGDKANHIILGMFEDAERNNGARDRRFRIEHAQHLRPDDIPRFAKLHVIASVQPYHAIDDGRWAEKRIGPERAKTTYAFHSLLEAGAVLAFGSDWYVAPMEPLLGIYAAATRRTLDGKHPDGWVPEQKITVAQAIRAYTWGSAYASFDESNKGTIEPGKLADFAVLSDDILSIDPVEISKTKVVMTVFDGKVVYERAHGTH